MNRPARTAVAGLFAATATPIKASGDPDLATFDRLVDFLVGAGVDGIVVGGATAEYPHFELEERQALIRRAARRLPSGSSLLVGIGSARVRHVLELGRCAIDAGARALLIPMPLFFRYEQHDLQAFCSHVSRTLRAPCLLYDLPDFTNALATETAIALLEREEHIVGIKDSSGRPERLAAFVAARNGAPWSLLVGDDGLLARGLHAGWDGGISGLASFCPELLVALHRAAVAGNGAAAATHQAQLEELLGQVSGLPAPWGVRIGLKARGLDTGALPLPLSPARREQIARFEAWLPGWLERAELPNLLVRT